jgi:chromosome segregation ATPase
MSEPDASSQDIEGGTGADNKEYLDAYDAERQPGTEQPPSAEQQTDAEQHPSIEQQLDQGFQLLEKMTQRLPEMERHARTLARARHARRLLALRRQADGLENEFNRLNATMTAAMGAVERAAAENDEAAQGREMATVRMTAEMVALKRAPLERARRELHQALADGELLLNDALDEIAMTDEQFDALEAELASFQDSLQQTHKLCTELQDIHEATVNA